MSGQTLLFAASHSGNIDLVRLLLDRGANVQQKDEMESTALHCSITPEISRLLIHRGADIHAKDKEGQTPLHFAVKNSNTDVCEMLLKQGAPPDVQDTHGDTPLHLACENGNSHIVAVLLIHGASANIQNEDGDTPTQKTRIRGWESEAKQHSKRECVDLLTQWRALRPLPAFCVLKVCERHIDISRLPRHLQQEITEIREAPIQQWPMLIDRLTQRRAGVEPAHTQT
eukprot:TRINITY_DN1789_c0_g1_i4.p1 TRINITY_DN1789_c0_g1~~TRINITY_DN1789_c0_g1_i4.p1  ORF type:complete len:257 (-),score=63.65 TRINITY_DN1789_c0_g1_i4:137-820(-)